MTQAIKQASGNNSSANTNHHYWEYTKLKRTSQQMYFLYSYVATISHTKLWCSIFLRIPAFSPHHPFNYVLNEEQNRHKLFTAVRIEPTPMLKYSRPTDVNACDCQHTQQITLMCTHASTAADTKKHKWQHIM